MTAPEDSPPAIIPVVDVRQVEERAQIGNALARAHAVTLVGHGVEPARQDAVLAAGRRVFALPDDVKRRYAGPLDGTQRGFLPERKRLPSGQMARDRKEAWHARPAGHPVENVFPSEVPEFGVRLRTLLAHVDRLAANVLDGIDAYLGTPVGRLADWCRGGDTLFRVSHYPGRDEAGDGQAFRAHQDFDLVTLLLGTNGPGLEVQDADGRWRAATVPPDAVLAIAGELLEVESEGRIGATRHRVVQHPRPAGTVPSARLAMVYFVGPRPSVVLGDGRNAGDVLDASLRAHGYA